MELPHEALLLRIFTSAADRMPKRSLVFSHHAQGARNADGRCYRAAESARLWSYKKNSTQRICFRRTMIIR